MSIKKPVISGKLHWYHWLVVLASAALTLSAWYITQLQVKQKNEAQFGYQAKQIIQIAKERMEKYEDALYAGVAAIHGEDGKSNANHWKKFSAALSIETKYPGINGIGVIYYVEPANLENYLTEEREVRPDYKIHPPHQKSEYWPITYIEPLGINRKALGLDMAHESNRLNAAKKARDTGLPQITGPITLVQDAKSTPGFLFYAPYYQSVTPPDSIELRQKQFMGIVYAPFIMEKLMLGTLQNKNRLVNFRISDGDFLLYDELTDKSQDYDPNPQFHESFQVSMYGREWVFDIQTTLLFREQNQNNQPLIILFGGIFIDSMLLTLFIILVNTNKKSFLLAEEMTKEFKLSEHKLNLTIDSMLDGLATISRDNKVLTFNQTAKTMFAIRGEQIQDIDFSDLVLLPKGTSKDNLMEYFFSIGLTEVQAKRNDESLFPLEISVNQMDVEGEHIFIAILRDITERKATEKLKSQFVSTVSHELRTPLTSIRGALGLALNSNSNMIDENMRNLLVMANKNSERLTLLINDLLDFEKIDSNDFEINLSLIDVVALLKNAIDDNSGFALEHDVKLLFATETDSLLINADSHRLLQAFTNLLSNAVKYSPQNGEVKVTIELVSDKVRVGVSDQGAGIPEEFHDRVFQRFAQADSSDTRKVGGTGLGLSICKAIIELHEGSLYFKTSENNGTQFFFELDIYHSS
ncbi:CHASE domain-containing sensor histidine kinase [Aliikangiella sp. IMCC44359]|uniref:CHASE domain-containing sensor histidine kinase n=1 Tax=Aliikangiella sp. IMCC44359 TaxID=3459125 RepID=UPI00403A7F4E